MEDDDLQRPSDELADDRFLLGTPAEISAASRRYDDALDVDTMFLRMNWPGMPVERAVEAIELVDDEVLPAL